jgi:hypothetical protein
MPRFETSRVKDKNDRIWEATTHCPMPIEKQRLVFLETRLAHRCQGLKLQELKTSINRVMTDTLRKSEHENIKLRI